MYSQGNFGGALWWWGLISPYKKKIALGLLATLACGIAASWVPFWAGRAVNDIEIGNFCSSRLNLAWMLAFTAAAGIGRYNMRNILIGLSRQIERRQREAIYDFLLARPFSFFERQATGDLMSRIGDDVSTVRMATGPGLMSLLQTASILPMTLALMAHLNLGMTLAVLAPFSLLPVCFYFLGRWSHSNQQKLQLLNSGLTTFSHETISGEKTVQAFCLEGIRVESFSNLAKAQARLNLLQTVLFSSYGPAAMVVGGASIIVLVWHGGGMVLDGRLGYGDLAAFTGYLAALGWPIMSVGWAANLFQRGRAGQLRIEQLLAARDAPVPEPVSAALRHGAVSFELKDVEMRFETGRGLGPISVSVPAGGSLAIVGPIGSGKTLLLQVAAGLRNPQFGGVFVDGRPLESGNLRSHWASLGWVPQEAALFSGSMRENLCLGSPDASESEIWEAAQAACLDEFIRRLPDGLDTLVGERGAILSGGERQRAALARALLRRPGALLLDDCLSAIDAETENRILANLRLFLGRATILLATHRTFVAELCENAIVLHDGKLVQAGAPADLSIIDGPYAKICRLQSLGKGRPETYSFKS